MSAPPPSSVRLAKLRAVVAREGLDDVREIVSQPATKTKIGSSTKPADDNTKAPVRTDPPGRSVRTAMLIAMLAWTLIMPVALVVLILIRQGEGVLPNLPLLTIIRSNAGTEIVSSVAGLWVVGLLYALPSIVAALRGHAFFVWILLLDIIVSGLIVLTGWAFVLWAALLVAAMLKPGRQFHAAFGRIAGNS